MTWLIIFACYIAIPALSILISGRSVTLKGWVLFLLLWSVLWMFAPPEELP